MIIGKKIFIVKRQLHAKIHEEVEKDTMEIKKKNYEQIRIESINIGRDSLYHITHLVSIFHKFKKKIHNISIALIILLLSMKDKIQRDALLLLISFPPSYDTLG